MWLILALVGVAGIAVLLPLWQVRRYASAAVIAGIFIVAIGIILRSTAYAELAGQAMMTGGVILVVVGVWMGRWPF